MEERLRSFRLCELGVPEGKNRKSEEEAIFEDKIRISYKLENAY